jgi:adenosylcobinamide-phosphate synthase
MLSSRIMLISPGANPLLVLLLALLFDLVLGGMPGLWRIVPHPVTWVGAAISWLERRLNRPERSDRARLARGAIATFGLVAAAAAFGGLLARGFYALPHSSLLEALTVAVLLAQRELFDRVAAVAASLPRGLAAARTEVHHIVGRDPESLDEHGVARAAIESLAENFSDGVVAPALFFLALGLPGICLYKAANTLDSMIGHRSPRYLAFGRAAARLDDLLNLVPARLAGALLALAAAALPRMSARGAWAAMLRDASKHRSPNAGWPEAAAAGALGLALGGPRRYGGTLAPDIWLGEGRARATASDIAAALRLYCAACLLQAGLLLLGLLLER